MKALQKVRRFIRDAYVVIDRFGTQRGRVGPDESAKPRTDAWRARHYLVPGEGVEPSRYCYRRILSPLRLPFRHPGEEDRRTP